MLLLLILILIIYYMVYMHRRYSGVYTYCLREIDFKFQVLEKDTCDVLIFGGGDSVFYSHPLNGTYLGIEFFLSNDSNIIYLGPYFPIKYHQTENKYVIKSIARNIDGSDPYESYENNEEYWGFFGGCDQGRYTFGVMRNKRDYGFLEPLEWK